MDWHKVSKHGEWIVAAASILGGWFGRHRIGSLWRSVDRLNDQAAEIAHLQNALQRCEDTKTYLIQSMEEIRDTAELVERARLRISQTMSAPSSAAPSPPSTGSPSLPSPPGSSIPTRRVSRRVTRVRQRRR